MNRALTLAAPDARDLPVTAAPAPLALAPGIPTARAATAYAVIAPALDHDTAIALVDAAHALAQTGRGNQIRPLLAGVLPGCVAHRALDALGLR